jgi:hypothetical protein
MCGMATFEIKEKGWDCVHLLVLAFEICLEERYECTVSYIYIFFSLAVQPPWALASSFSFMII